MLPLELWLLRSNYNWMAGLSEQLPEVAQTGQPQRPFTRPWPIVLVRNALFAALVLLHGFRRLLPPY
jgi:hypothetical protein